MTPETAVQLIRQALLTALILAAPILLIGFLVGVAVNIIQVATSMQDSAFGTVPRLAAFLAGVIVLIPWMLRMACSYTVSLFGNLSLYAR